MSSFSFGSEVGLVWFVGRRQQYKLDGPAFHCIFQQQQDEKAFIEVQGESAKTAFGKAIASQAFQLLATQGCILKRIPR